jgi:DNA-binding transcriptional LysR family regulator
VELHEVDLNLLVALDALLGERSVTSAAARLCVGQSAMSSTLARLRRLFDDPLLVREGRTMVPTPYAASLAEPVREVLDRVTALLAGRDEFDPQRDERALRVIASDYTMVTFLAPLLARLEDEAPGIALWVSPPGDDYVDRLARGRVDLVVMPSEVFGPHRDFPHLPLFSDRFVCAVDADNDRVGRTITLEEFSSLPYLATSCGHEVSPAEAQLDKLGIARNTEITTAFGLAPLLLRGTRRIALVHERLAWQLADQVRLRLLEPPMPLEPIHQLLLWAHRAEHDPGHRWLRNRIVEFAGERDRTAPRLRSAS